MDQLPPAEAYGRVSDPRRYELLHHAARGLLERLTEEYLVDRLEGAKVDEPLVEHFRVGSVVRLAPASGSGAPLVIAFTTFPGLRVRYGRWLVDTYPTCGCDACDEAPESLAAELVDCAGILAAGGFREAVQAAPPTLRFEFVGQTARWSARGGERQLSQVDVALPEAGLHHDWSRWPRR